jgi:hypothetical protein
MMPNLVSMYEDGVVTASDLAVECLHMVDPENPGLVLEFLPGEVLGKLREFVEEYRPDGMATNHGLLPASDQVEAAKAWIEGKRNDVAEEDESDWDKYQMGTRIREILGQAPSNSIHESGRFFMTAYQIAIEFARNYEDDFKKMKRPIGGVGAGNRALSKYIATQLARKIKARKLPTIEIQFFHSLDVKSLTFRYRDDEIVATPNDAGYPNSMYRLK